MERLQQLLKSAEMLCWLLPISLSVIFTYRSIDLEFFPGNSFSLERISTMVLIVILSSILPVSIKLLRTATN